MLSLLSLLIASGTVLRADTEPWTPSTYPDPRTNATQCNTAESSTLCDPDHLLTDQWRATIDENVKKQVDRLRNVEIQYVDDAPQECLNGTDDFQIYVILARRIQTANNTTVTSADLTAFGNELADEFELNTQSCKNFLLLIVVEQAHEAYVRTGSHLKVPSDLMENVFNQSTNLFNEKNYMEVLSRIIDEIGEQMVASFAPPEPVVETTQEMVTETPVVENTDNSSVVPNTFAPSEDHRAASILIYIGMIIIVVVVIVAILMVAMWKYRCHRETMVIHKTLSPPEDRYDRYIRDHKEDVSSNSDLHINAHSSSHPSGGVEAIKNDSNMSPQCSPANMSSSSIQVKITAFNLSTDSIEGDLVAPPEATESCTL